MPIFLYRTSLISFDKEFAEEANKIIFDFIWEGKDKVKRSALISASKMIFVNHILLLAKQYLYCCRQNKYAPFIRVLNSKINTVFLIETMIAESNKMKWSKYKSD